MQTGWLNDDGTWYYLQESGRRAYGWINLDAWYYLDWNTGVMLTGEQEIDGQTYYLDASAGCARITGFREKTAGITMVRAE